jgi:colanic acid/amylovoran biosynthesis glycosyltransferase
MDYKITVANIWTIYRPDNFYSPHEYLLQKDGWESKTFMKQFVANDECNIEDLYYISRTDHVNQIKVAIFERFANKVFEKKRRIAFNDWCLKHSAFRNVQIVHAHFGNTAFEILPLIKQTKLPLVITFYGVDGSKLLLEERWVKRYVEMFKYTSRTIVLCEEVKERLMQLGLEESKIKLWQIPIDLDLYSYQERKKEDIVRFIIAARFVEKKGYPYLLKAFGKLVEEGRKVKLTIMGYGDSEKIEQYIAENKLNNHIDLINTTTLPSFATIYSKVLKEQDIFVLPSVAAKNGDDEGGPALTLVAAQAAGLPVICTAFPGSEISVIDERTGLICQSADVQSLYEKMLYLYERPKKWNEMGKAGSNLVNEKFSITTQMEEVIDIYKQAIQENSHE